MIFLYSVMTIIGAVFFLLLASKVFLLWARYKTKKNLDKAIVLRQKVQDFLHHLNTLTVVNETQVPEEEFNEVMDDVKQGLRDEIEELNDLIRRCENQIQRINDVL